MIGVNRGTTRAHIARAALEGIAFQTMDVLSVMELDAQIKISELRVDGGASTNNLLMQIQADLLEIPVVRPHITETTAMGAALLAGLATGFWTSISYLKEQWQINKRFDHQQDPEITAYMKLRWADAVKRAGGWAEE
jgi:glycerol kinase